TPGQSPRVFSIFPFLRSARAIFILSIEEVLPFRPHNLQQSCPLHTFIEVIMLSKSRGLFEVGRVVARRSATSALVMEPDAPAVCPFHALWAKRQTPSTPPVAPPAIVSRVRPYDAMPTPRALPIVGTTLDVARFGGATRIHEYCDHRHKQLGPIYREKLGTVEAVFVADSALIQQVYANEGRYPQHMVPEAWTIYNQKKNIKRGLFFIIYSEWLPIFHHLRCDRTPNAMSVSSEATSGSAGKSATNRPRLPADLLFYPHTPPLLIY
ncbi:cytochrome P450 315a1, partial [Tropilaelaps mercedesae]